MPMSLQEKTAPRHATPRTDHVGRTAASLATTHNQDEIALLWQAWDALVFEQGPKRKQMAEAEVGEVQEKMNHTSMEVGRRKEARDREETSVHCSVEQSAPHCSSLEGQQDTQGHGQMQLATKTKEHSSEQAIPHHFYSLERQTHASHA